MELGVSVVKESLLHFSAAAGVDDDLSSAGAQAVAATSPTTASMDKRLQTLRMGGIIAHPAGVRHHSVHPFPVAAMASCCIALLIGVVAMLLSRFGSGSVILLGLAAVLLDIAMTAHQVLGQREIYELRPDARARINTVYMGGVFAGGALGSALAGVLYSGSGWNGIANVGIALLALSFVLWAFGRFGSRGRRPPRPSTNTPVISGVQKPGERPTACGRRSA
jgi:MFS family permease